MLQKLPLDVLLRILSLLSRDDLAELGCCSNFLRQLANQSLLLNNISIQPHSNWIRESFFFDVSQMGLESLRHEEEEEINIIANENDKDNKQLLTDIYAEPFVFNDEETLAYMKILQGIHEKDATVFEEENTTTPELDGCEEDGLEKSSKNATSPSLSDYSKSSANSIFSELPPRLLNSEWNSPINELNTLSDDYEHENSDCESTSSGDSLDKLRSSNKVRDKAALFEKLMTKDTSSHNKSSQSKSSKGKSYGLLSDFFPGRPFNKRGRNISQGYIEEVARCNGENPVTTDPEEKQTNPAHGLEIEFSKKESSKRNRSNHLKKTQCNRLKAFVTQENRICYEKI